MVCFAGFVYSCWVGSWIADLLIIVYGGWFKGCALAVLRCYVVCGIFIVLVWFVQFNLFDFGVMGIVSVGYDGVWVCLLGCGGCG